MEVFVSHLPVVPWRVVLGKIICHVELAFAPDELELFLFDAVFYPVESHVEGFGELLTHC